MQRPALETLIVATVCALGVARIALPQEQSSTPTAPPPPVAPADFKPGMDDLMTLLVQPRHTKLFFAGARRNWELATAESRNLNQALTQIARVVPAYLNNDVKAAMTSMIVPQMRELDAAIAAADVKRFATAYVTLTQACNACHTYMEHPFLVIRCPHGANSIYSDQDFGPDHCPYRNSCNLAAEMALAARRIAMLFQGADAKWASL